MHPLASALDRCIAMMQRGTPHEMDADAWRDTIRQASIILDRHQARQPKGKSFWRPAAWLTAALIAALILLGAWAAPARATVLALIEGSAE